MILRTRFASAGLVLGLAVFGTTAAPALAQQPQTNNPATGVEQPRRTGPARRAMRRRARLGMFRALLQLNLTDEQKQQARSIIKTNRQNTKAERQELRQLIWQRRQGTLTPEGLARAKELRTELMQSRKATRTQLAGILTSEQKAKLEEMKKTRRANHEQFRRQNQTPN